MPSTSLAARMALLQNVKVAPPIKVFVKRAGDPNFASVTVPAGEGVFVTDLVEAVIAKLKWDVSPTRVSLTVEGAAKPLDSTASLASLFGSQLSQLSKIIAVAGACDWL